MNTARLALRAGLGVGRMDGAGSPIGPSSSAYAVFDQALPERFFFGLAKEPFDAEPKGQIYEVSDRLVGGRA